MLNNNDFSEIPRVSRANLYFSPILTPYPNYNNNKYNENTIYSELNKILERHKQKSKFVQITGNIFEYNNVFSSRQIRAKNDSINLNIQYKNDKLQNKINNVDYKILDLNQFNNFLINKNLDGVNGFNKEENNNNNSFLQKKTFLQKKGLFNVIHLKKEKNNKLDKRKIVQTNNINEIKILKYHKVVYANNYLLNSYNTSKNIKKFNNISFVYRNKTSSDYRGVSKNGNQWQVNIIIKKKNSYIGSFPFEILAARIYDILSLKNRGYNARTNFIYNDKQIKKICESNIDFKSKRLFHK